MSDLIDRQAAIDALDVLCQEHRYKIPGKVETYSQYNEAWQDALDRAEGAIGNLPSARSQQVTGKLNSDMISRQAAIDALKTWGLIDGLSEGQAIEILADEEKLPSAQPEIIRCKECKWHNGEINQCNAQICASMGVEDFCSKAERREE